MLGYDAHVDDISVHDLRQIGYLPYAQRTSYVGTLRSQRVAQVPCRTWVDHLLAASDDGHVQMLQDGGYPYRFCAPGLDIKTNFAAAGVEMVSALDDSTWYLVEAWDQS